MVSLFSASGKENGEEGKEGRNEERKRIKVEEE